jgi:hypothetical protein
VKLTKGILVLSSLVAALLGHTQKAVGQFNPPQIYVTNSFTTDVSGITYAKLSCIFPPCRNLFSHPVEVIGTNIYAQLDLFKPSDFCLCDFEPMNCPSFVAAEETLVLGALPSGDYLLWVLSPEDPLFGPGYTFTSIIPFTVSNSPPITPMLSISPTNSGLMHLDVAGISGATYIVQSSTDFTNWTSLWTNIGAPFWATVTGGTNTNCYFRTQIVSNP